MSRRKSKRHLWVQCDICEARFRVIAKRYGMFGPCKTCGKTMHLVAREKPSPQEKQRARRTRYYLQHREREMAAERARLEQSIREGYSEEAPNRAGT
jgi:hypothetical protein